MSKLSIILLFLVFLSLLASGQDCHLVLEGSVQEENGMRLAGATVVLGANQHVAATDDSGFFQFTHLCEGRYLLQANYVGFETQTVAVTVPSKNRIVITLKTSSTTLQDVVIEGEQTGVSATQTVSSLSKDELLALHGRPLGESLKEIPGVSVIQTGPSIFKPVIHGLHSQRILILNNGIRQEGQQWGIEHAPEVDPFIASSIDVVKGAEAVRYGSDAIGGVIIISPPPLHEVRELGGELNLGFMSNNRMGVFSGMLEGNVSKNSLWHWRVQSSVKKGGDFHAAKYNLSNTGTEELNFSAAAGYKKENRGVEFYVSSFNTEIAILRAAHSGNLNDLQHSIERSEPWYIEDFTYDINNPYQKINHQLLKVKGYFPWNDRTRINVLYGGQYNQRKEFDIRRSGRSTTPAISMNLISHVLDLSLDHEKGTHSGSIGINGTYKYNRNQTEETGIRPLLPDYEQLSGGIFVLEKLKKNRWLLEAGARYDHQFLKAFPFQQQTLLKPTFNFNFFSGTLGASFLVNPNLRIISNLGFASRPPHVSELYSEGLHHGTGSIEEGMMRRDDVVSTDQDLIRTELSKKWMTTLQVSREHINLDFSVYYNDFDNYVFLRPSGTRATIRGFFPVFRFEQTDAVLMGSDLGIKWQITETLSYQGKFSYIHARDVLHDDVLIFIPPSQIENGITYNFRDVRKMKNLFISISAPLTFEQTRAPRVVYPNQLETNTSAEIFDFAPAPGSYVLVNVRAGVKIPIKERTLSIILSGENLLNNPYRNYMNRLRYFADDTGSNFIVRFAYHFYKH
jgi:iron complex outermembrane receptor protein